MPQRGDPTRVHCAVRCGTTGRGFDVARYENCARNKCDVGKRKNVPYLSSFASDFRLLRAFVVGRMKRLQEINPPLNECVRAVCDLLSGVLTVGRSKKVPLRRKDS